jgi:hypothetical protein
MEDLARTWAAGPTGRRLGRATVYWGKVKEEKAAQDHCRDIRYGLQDLPLKL